MATGLAEGRVGQVLLKVGTNVLVRQSGALTRTQVQAVAALTQASWCERGVRRRKPASVPVCTMTRSSGCPYTMRSLREETWGRVLTAPASYLPDRRLDLVLLGPGSPDQPSAETAVAGYTPGVCL